MILLDGKKLAERLLNELKNDIAKKGKKLRLGVVVVGKDSVIEKFVAQKKKAAEETGIYMRVYPFREAITTNELRKRISAITHEKKKHRRDYPASIASAYQQAIYFERDSGGKRC